MPVLADNKRLAKNTLLLYMRTFLLMGISLYTSREVLAILGETDFGIYNIVGGVVVLFAFLNHAMMSSTQRFISHALGKDDIQYAKDVFNESFRAHLIICGIILLLGETVGLWFTYYKLNIPPESRITAVIVFQFSLLNCCFSVLCSSFNACVIAYEKMSFYGYLSVAEGLFKLGLVFLLLTLGSNRLVAYSIFMASSTFIILVWIYFYSRSKFPIVRFQKTHDRKLLKDLLSFSGWSLFGNASLVGVNQGIGIMMNLFFGVIVNAAIGIANQVSSAVYAFLSNFQLAFAPQIVKTYAAGERSQFINLIIRASRISLLLVALVGVPIFFYVDVILNWWLTEVPLFTASFVRLILLSIIFEALSGPLWRSIQAGGKIKNYQIIISIIYFLSLPICFLLIKMGANEWQAYLAKLIIDISAYLFRISYITKNFGIPVGGYIKEVIGRAGMILLLSSIFSLVIRKYCDIDIMGVILSFISNAILILYLGVSKKERIAGFNFIKSKIHPKSVLAS